MIEVLFLHTHECNRRVPCRNYPDVGGKNQNNSHAHRTSEDEILLQKIKVEKITSQPLLSLL